MSRTYDEVNQMDASHSVIDELEKDFDAEGLPGPGDLMNAIEKAGYKLVPLESDE